MSTINKPNDFQPNTTIASSEVNDNFDTIYSEFNGNISSTNLADNAVTTAKIADDAVTAAKIADGTITSAQLSSETSKGYYDLGDTPDTVTYNGNRSYDLVFNSNDLTDTVSNGMRMKLTRTVTPPTQCTDLESGSSQYWSRASASVAGTTFTDDFCAGAWIKLESYTGATTGLISRYNGTSGWALLLSASGQVMLQGWNAASGNYSRVVSRQSVPLNKWVHVAAQLDMSAFTATTTTSYVMFDGVDKPSLVERAGTNPTALVQAGNLNVGAFNATGFFDGEIAQAWYSNAKITQANIVTFISQGMTASETSIVSHYDFNGDANDNNANANNLTANGGAGFSTDSPFNATEYGIITANTFSTNTTLTVQVPEGYAIPTSGGVSAVSYSTQDVPYGFPSDKDRWTVTGVYVVNDIITGSIAGTWGAFTGSDITVPTGRWTITGGATITASSSTPATFWIQTQIDTATPTTNRPNQYNFKSHSSTSFIPVRHIYSPEGINLTSATVHRLYGVIISGSGTQTAYIEQGFHSFINFEFAYI